jgi:hypothetical protein
LLQVPCFLGVGDLECFFAAQGFEAQLKRL